MNELTKEEYKKILQDCGFHRVKAAELSGKIKEKVEKKLKDKEVVFESKDIQEPKNTYKER